MKPLRAAIVTRRFWPLVGGPERVLANLAAELRPRGVEATIVTVRWLTAWPAEPLFCDVPVVRLEPPPSGPLEHACDTCGRWPAGCGPREEFDVVYVSQLQPGGLRGAAGRAAAHAGASCGPSASVAAAIASGRSTPPAAGESSGECMAAAGVAAPTRAVQRELEAAGYPRRRIAYLPNGVSMPPPRTPQTQAAARTVLAEAHAALQLPDRASLAVAIGRLQAVAGDLDRLLTAWRPIAGPMPRARLWLAGPAADRPRHPSSRSSGCNWPAGCWLSATSISVDELLAAADLLVAPSPEGSPVTLLEAMAAGLPIVAADTAANRSVLTDGQEGLLVADADAAALLAAIARLSQERGPGRPLGAAPPGARAEAEFSLARMADQHVTWFQTGMHLDPAQNPPHHPLAGSCGGRKANDPARAGLPRRQFDVHVCAADPRRTAGGRAGRAGVPVTVIGKRWRVDPQAFWRLMRHVGRLQARSGPHLALCRQRLRLRGGPGVRRAARDRRPAVRRSLEGLARIGRRSPPRPALRPRGGEQSGRARLLHRARAAGGEDSRAFPTAPFRPRQAAAPAGKSSPSWACPNKSRLIGLVGRLWPQKRVKDAIWAADLLKVIRDNVHLLIFGDGPHRSRLERFRDQVVIRDKVHFLGHRNDVPRFLPHFNVLWSTSGYEGQSNAVLEAMAAGVPVVASDIPGNRNLVVPDQTGYLAAVGHRAAFARWTNQILDDAALARRLGRAAQERAGGEFSVEAMVGRYVELYEELMSAGR